MSKQEHICTCWKTCYYGHYRTQYGESTSAIGSYRCDYATMEDKPRTIRQGKKIEQGKVIDGKCGFYITKKGKATAERIKREEEKARKAQEREAAKPQIDLELVKELHQQGLPNREILERTGYSRHYLEKALKEPGLHANRLVSWRHKQMLRLYQDGALDAEIAEAVGIGRRSVTEWRYRHALPSNWRREKKQE